ncbi:MAG: hypothetical protein OSB62_07810 [Alphaproteobacteria bacterium]|nr:hypothetical protein [Alphaproteobacteria bacterium]
MADQQTTSSETPKKKKLNIGLRILKGVLYYLIAWPVLLLMGAARNRMKILWDYKQIVLERIFWVGLLILTFFNPLFLISDAAWTSYSSLVAYGADVIAAGQASLAAGLVFAALVVTSLIFIAMCFNSTFKSFGVVPSLAVISVPTLLVAAAYFTFPALQQLAATSIFWVVEGILSFYLGCGVARSKVQRKMDGVGHQHIVADNTSNDQDDNEG